MKRVLLKLSGEALAGEKKTGFDEATCVAVAKQVKQLVDKNIEAGIVIGGGNFWRGRTSEKIDRPKADGIVISKTRYLIPEKDGLTIELDIFHKDYDGLFLAEVEFCSEEQANAYVPPAWFGEDVTYSSEYHNSTLSKGKS